MQYPPQWKGTFHLSDIQSLWVYIYTITQAVYATLGETAVSIGNNNPVVWSVFMKKLTLD